MFNFWLQFNFNSLKAKFINIVKEHFIKFYMLSCKDYKKDLLQVLQPH